MSRLARCSLALLVANSGICHSLDAQFRGRVIDQSGRPLPFVTIATQPALLRGTNEFVDEPSYRTLTDLAGEFQIPDSLLPRDALWAGALGYSEAKVGVDGRRNILITLRRGGQSDDGVLHLGLAADPQLVLRLESSGSIGNQDLRVGREYDFIVTMHGTKCEEPGATLAEKKGSSVTIAVSVVLRRNVCTLAYVEHEVAVPLVFDRPGLIEVRVIGRWSDVLRTFNVRN